MHTTNLIGPTGPLLQVHVLVSAARRGALLAASQQVPAPQASSLLIDTGASCTVIDLPVIQALGLQPTGSTPGHTPSTGSTPVVMSTYDIDLVIFGGGQGVNHQVFNNLPVVGADFSGQPIDGLLGRDVLAACRLTYSGPDSLVMLSF